MFSNTAKAYQFNEKNSEIKDYVSCLSKAFKKFCNWWYEKTGLKRVVKFVSVDFNPIGTDDIHKYLMKKPDANNVWLN